MLLGNGVKSKQIMSKQILFSVRKFLGPSVNSLRIFLIILPMIPLILTQTVLASQIKLAWDPNTEPDLAGYKVYFGTASRTYGPPIDVGNITKFTLPGLSPGQTYYFAVTAYDTSDNGSGPSNEVSGLPSEHFEALVTQYYNDVLDRGPEPGGAEFWSAEIERIASYEIDFKEGFLTAAKIFFNSAEYLSMA